MLQELKANTESTLPPTPISRQARRATERSFAKHREMEDRELDDDRLYFLENPSRNHRIRYAFPNEEKNFRELYRAANGSRELSTDLPLVILVKQFEPGIRVRKPTALQKGIPIGRDQMPLITEEQAQKIFDNWAPDLSLPKA